MEEVVFCRAQEDLDLSLALKGIARFGCVGVAVIWLLQVVCTWKGYRRASEGSLGKKITAREQHEGPCLEQ